MPPASQISDYLWLIPLLPFAGFLINGAIGRKLPRALVTAVALICTAIPAAIVAWLWVVMKAAGAPDVIEVVSQPWIQITGFTVNFAITVDHLTLIMLGVVTGVGFLIHIYSVGYMAHEEGYWRFFAYLNLFMFFMSVLVLAESFLLMFVGWEGVGLASYLLIGFYFKKDSAVNAGKKAFIVTRIGDFGFLLAMFLIVREFGSLDFTHVFNSIAVNPDWHGGVLTAIALLLVLGATGKSAQIPLYVWLPDAMEGPTPVSALIHAATMVTAGVYMVVRSHTLFDRSPFALGVVAIIGAATALFAATVGMVQTDIKRVLAYSTISQLGYMFLACGAAAYSAAIFHLVTHAFFKGLLFLAAGSVIHGMGGQQDMREMGGLRKKVPITFWTMSAGVFAISGIPPFSGFFSKDAILYQAFLSPTAGPILWFVGLVTVLLTAFYMFRLWYLTFFGEIRSHDAHPHESPWSMLVPLIILAVLAVAGGWIGIPKALGGGDQFAHFLEPVVNAGPQSTPAGTEGQERVFSLVSVVMAAIGWFIADLLYRRKPGLADQLVERVSGVYGLLVHKYWIDQIYTGLIVTPLLFVTRHLLWGVADRGVVDGGVGLAAYGVRGVGAVVQRVQSGNIRSYAGWLALGAAALLLITYFGFSMQL